MSCLVHHKKYLSSFHNFINDCRTKNYIPVSILVRMPRQCCTCKNENKDIIEIEVVKDECQLEKLSKIIERVAQEKQTNPTLILSLNCMIKLVNENAKVTKNLQQTEANETLEESDLSLDFEHMSPMDTSRGRLGRGRPSKERKVKPITTGTFVFLPYPATTVPKEGSVTDCYTALGQELRAKRFWRRGGHIIDLQSVHDVLINIITSKTSAQVKQALKKATKGIDNLTIHNRESAMETSKLKSGVWCLVRSKNHKNKTNTTDFEDALNDLINRWESNFSIEKRARDDDEDEDDGEDDEDEDGDDDEITPDYSRPKRKKL